MADSPQWAAFTEKRTAAQRARRERERAQTTEWWERHVQEMGRPLMRDVPPAVVMAKPGRARGEPEAPRPSRAPFWSRVRRVARWFGRDQGEVLDSDLGPYR